MNGYCLGGFALRLRVFNDALYSRKQVLGYTPDLIGLEFPNWVV